MASPTDTNADAGATAPAAADAASSAPGPLPPFAPACDPLARVPLYPMEKLSSPLRIAVTGASGYVAGAVVARLLAAGHTVVATVRDPSNQAIVGPLKALPGAAQRLELFAADLLVPGSFDAALSGCEVVIHTASPFIINIKPGEGRARLVDPAVKGVENVIASIERTPSVTRLVLTSSIAAIMWSNPNKCRPGHHQYDETDWNGLASETVMPYAYSKTAAERRAWELARGQSRWSLVAMCPGLVLGPPLSSRTDSESVALVQRLVAGEMWPAAPPGGLSCVDVRDVAAAHCLAAVHPGAKGRYALVGADTDMRSLAGTVAGLYPGGRVWRPAFLLPRWLMVALAPLVGLPKDSAQYTMGFSSSFDTSKVRTELGLAFTPIEVTLRDMVEDLAARGLARHPKPSAADPAAKQHLQKQ
ncbi:hypothetical protein GPECTOR_94g654 [Gonium pectorale]|uniref:NAD-dependent epimerase/dehydratase domain-containing protein n=1 Tax=Gonium pectorale TaxID=33097 RepID=A0A150G0F6_GONPE|nr:hypothetical protein GPECTOR_94g654 [Gonium pectorale]|eukprot:KXZ43332.1 hypothetical protein GPECTOR_94g654 [Gonium pectorale]